jgi:hypothetical protein
MQKTLSWTQPQSRPPPPLKGRDLEYAVLKWLQDRPRGAPDDIKTTFNTNTPEDLADALKALQFGRQITILEEDGIAQFVGSRCTMCHMLVGWNPACKVKHQSPKQGWSCQDFEKKAVKKSSQKDDQESTGEPGFDQESWLSRLEGSMKK